MKGEYCDVNGMAEVKASDLKGQTKFQRHIWTSASPDRKGNIYFSHVLYAELSWEDCVHYSVIYICGTFGNEKL
jgi:hypothetical protein